MTAKPKALPLVIASAVAAGSFVSGLAGVAEASTGRFEGAGPSGTAYSASYSCIEADGSYTWDRTTVVPGTGVSLEVLTTTGGNVVFGGDRKLDMGDLLRARRPLLLSNQPPTITGDHVSLKLFEVDAAGARTLVIEQAIDCPDYSALGRSSFVAIAPERVLDTRPGQRINSDGVKPRADGTVTIPSTALVGMPDGAVAVSMTLTASASEGRGFVQAFPTNEAQAGSSSTLNFTGPNQTVANATFVPLGDDGSVTLFTNVAAHLIVDVNGYFVDVDAAGATSGGRFAAIEPLRIYDTRSNKQVNHTGPAVAPDAVANVDLTLSESGLPSGALAAVVNITATRNPSAGFVQAGPGGTLVKGSNSVLNVYDPSETIAGMAVVPLADDGSIDILTSNGADIIIDLVGWFTADGDTSDVGLFVPLPPQRIYDTRFNNSISAVGGRDGFIDIDVGYTEGTAGVVGTYGVGQRTSVSAVMTNLTVSQALGSGFFEVRALIGRGDGGLTSSLNLPAAGATKANAVVAPVSEGGANFSVYGSAGGHVIVDATGFFT